MSVIVSEYPRSDPFTTVISDEVEHAIHEFLPINEVVCVLRCVSPSWRSRVADALQGRFQWDVRYRELESVLRQHVWLEIVARARVRIRSLCLDARDEPAALICAAALAGHANAVGLLARRFPSLVNATDAHNRTPLHHGAFGEYRDGAHRDVVEALLAMPNIEVNAADELGRTALSDAVFRNRRDVIELLLAAPSIDVNAADIGGQTPLHVAAWKSRREVVRILLVAPRIDVNAADRRGRTALHRATCADVVKALLAAPGIDANAVTRDGYTPLHDAALNGDRDVIEALLAAPNIDTNAVDAKGRTPLDLAIWRGHRDAIEVLRVVTSVGAPRDAEN